MHLVSQLMALVVIIFGVALVAALDALGDQKELNQALCSKKRKLEGELFEARLREEHFARRPDAPDWWAKRKKRRR